MNHLNRKLICHFFRINNLLLFHNPIIIMKLNPKALIFKSDSLNFYHKVSFHSCATFISQFKVFISFFKILLRKTVSLTTSLFLLKMFNLILSTQVHPNHLVESYLVMVEKEMIFNQNHVKVDNDRSHYELENMGRSFNFKDFYNYSKD